MTNPKNYSPKNPRMTYTAQQKQMVKYLFETEGLNKREIADKTGMNYTSVCRLIRNHKMRPGKNIQLIEQTTIKSRLEKAKQLGIGEVDQMMKAKQLMEADQSVQISVPKKDRESKTVEGQFVNVSIAKPDFKIQNEGLKRAMELTGTKIERKEIALSGGAEVVHRYELPAKKSL